MRLDYYLPKKFQGYLSTGFVLFLFAVLLSSCLKNDDDDFVPETSNVLIVNAYPHSPFSSIYFVYANSYIINKDDPYEYSSNSPYYEGLTYGYSMVFTTDLTKADSVITDGPAPGESKDYSVFIVGKKDTSFIVRDDLITPEASKVAIRFVNASKNAGAVDVKLNGTTAFSNIEFKKNSDFKQFDNATVAVEVYEKNSTTTMLTSKTLNLTAGKSYTIYIRGIKDSPVAAKALGIGTVDHTSAKQ